MIASELDPGPQTSHSSIVSHVIEVRRVVREVVGKDAECCPVDCAVACWIGQMARRSRRRGGLASEIAVLSRQTIATKDVMPRPKWPVKTGATADKRL
jgi:hypothetical protein